MENIEEIIKTINNIVPSYDTDDNDYSSIEKHIKNYLTQTVNILNETKNNDQLTTLEKRDYITNEIRKIVYDEIAESNSGGIFYGHSRQAALQKFLEFINPYFHFDDNKGKSIYIEETAKYEEEEKKYYPYKR